MVFLNDDLLSEDFDASSVKSKPQLTVQLLQVKRETTFKEDAVDKFSATLRRALDISNTENLSTYNDALKKAISVFREVFVRCAPKHPRLHIQFTYVCRGEPAAAHPKIAAKLGELHSIVSEMVPDATIEARLIGARQLIEAAQSQKTYSISLPFVEILISPDQSSYVTLVRMSEYVRFISDGRELRRHLFEWNVRDWQGDIGVNREIEDTVSNKSAMDFWWLNNGVTVICSEATIAGKVIALSDVQIVNGLQTSVSIHNALSARVERQADDRSVLVKIIKTSDAIARDKIIKATNYQTAIQPASLKATDAIQRDIESYFLRKGWFYDRRKNFYKNSGKPLDRIIGISYLAQAVMAVVLQQPDYARARPSTLIKRTEDYQEVFSSTIDFEVYLFCTLLVKWIEQAIRADDLAGSEPLWVMREFRFHMAYAYVAFGVGRACYGPAHLLPLLREMTIDSVRAHVSMKFVMACVWQFVTAERTGWGFDRAAKSSEFLQYLQEAIRIDINKGEGIRLMSSDGPRE